jgi:hypothetical protein
MNRHERRRAQKLQRVVDEVDRTAFEPDRRFFADNPNRNYRVRPASDVEISEIEMRYDTALSGRWFVSVTRLGSGIRSRNFFEVPSDAPWRPGLDLGEDICRSYAASLPGPLQAVVDEIKEDD